MTYRVTVNGKELAEGSLQEVKAAVAGLVTSRLNEDPERLAADAQAALMAFNTGAVEEALKSKGQWFTAFDAYSENPAYIRITQGEVE